MDDRVSLIQKPSTSEEFPLALQQKQGWGLFMKLLKPLKDEGLIIDMIKESRIIPKDELYERLDYLYRWTGKV